MEEENTDKRISKKDWFKRGRSGGDKGGMVWILGFIGASIYYVQQAQSFGDGFGGILKALAWPAILIYKLLQFLE